MPIFEYKCSICSEVMERIEPKQMEEVTCSFCGYPSFPIQSVPGLAVFIGAGFSNPNRHLTTDKIVDNCHQYGHPEKPRD